MASARRRSSNVVYWLDNNVYLNITNRCSNNCYFCFKKFKNGIRKFHLKLQREPSSDEVIKELGKVISKRKWSEVVFCGFGEPLERLDCILEVARWIKKHHRKVIRIDTNGQGYLLNEGRKVVKELKEAGVDKISVSLNAHDEITYRQVCKPRFNDAHIKVLEFIEKAEKENLNTEVTAVNIPEVNIPKVREIAQNKGAKFRVREYIPCFW